MKKLLFFMPNLLGGGAEKVLVSLVNNLDRTKYDITVMTLFDVGENKEDMSPYIHYCSCFKKIIKGNTYLFKLFGPEFLCKCFVKEDYDVIVSYLQSSVTRILSGYKGNGKLICWIHNDYKTEAPLLRLFRNRRELVKAYNRYDEIVFVSKACRNSFEGLFPEITTPKTVLYNTIEDQRILSKGCEMIDERIYDKNWINLISVGRFVEQKAFDRLFRIMGKLIYKDGLKVRLYILGKGPLEKFYVDEIKKNKVEDYVFLLGYQRNPYKYVKQADLFVCSSLHEGYSTAVTEALILGTPVVTTDCSGMDEMLGNNEFGVITENNEEALYLGLRTILIDSERGILQKLKVVAEKRGRDFSKDRLLAQTEIFIDDQLK